MKCMLTKLAGAGAIAVGLVAVSYGFGSATVSPQSLSKNVFMVDMSTLTQPAATSTGGASSTAAAAAATLPPIAGLLAKADADAGQKYAKICSTCHSFNKGEPAKMGPNLYGIIGLHHAHMVGFTYSEGMKATADHLWTFEELNHFLYNPRAWVPGTKMPYAGIKNDSDRANVIAWLRTLSDRPEALPTR